MSEELANTVPPRKDGLVARLLQFRRGPWEGVATALIVLGLFMLMQSLAIELYTYSFVTILAGAAMFVVVSHFRD